MKLKIQLFLLASLASVIVQPACVGQSIVSHRDSLLAALSYDLYSDPANILRYNLGDLENDDDISYTINLVKTLSSVDASTVNADLLLKTIIPFMVGRFQKLAESTDGYSSLSMGRPCLVETNWQKIQARNNESLIRAYYSRCQTASNAMWSYSMNMAQLSEHFQTEAENLNDLHYIEAFLYGTDLFVRTQLGHDIPNSLYEELSLLTDSFPRGEDYYKQLNAFQQGIGQLASSNQMQKIMELARPILEYCYIKVPSALSLRVFVILGAAYSASRQGDTTITGTEWMLSLAKQISEGAYNKIEASFRMNRWAENSLSDFLTIQSRLQAEGHRFAESLPLFWIEETSFSDGDEYREYLDSFFSFLHALFWAYTSAGDRDYIIQYNDVLKMAVEEWPDPVDLSLKALSLSTWYLTRFGETSPTLLEIIDGACTILDLFHVSHPIIMTDVAGVYYNWGLQEKMESILRRFCHNLEGYYSFPRDDQDILCENLRAVAGLARLLASLEKQEYLQTCSVLENTFYSHITKVSNKENRAYLKGCLGGYLMDSRRYDDAINIYKSALRDTRDNSLKVWIGSGIFESLFELGRYREAVEMVDDTILESFMSSQLFCAEFIESIIQSGRRTEILPSMAEYYRTSMESYASSLLMNLDIEEREQAYKTIRSNHSRLLKLLDPSYETPWRGVLAGIHYDWTLITKGLLLKADKTLDDFWSKNEDPSVRKRYQEMKHYADAVDYILVNGGAPTDLAYLKAQMSWARRDLMTLVRRTDGVKTEEELFGTTWKEIRSSIGEDNIAIEMIEVESEGGKEYYALLIDPDLEFPVSVFLCKDKDLRVNNSNRSIYITGPSKKKLYNAIWKPLEEYITEKQNVFFAVDGSLHGINIEALSSDDGILAEDRFNLHRLSSTGILVRQPQQELTGKAVLFGGLDYQLGGADNSENITPSINPGEQNWVALPETLVEVETIASLLDNQHIDATLLTGADGQEESFKALSGSDVNILLMSTHGFYSDKNKSLNPMLRSGLVMSRKQNQKGDQDGFIFAEEVAAMNLKNTALVVLSACQTALGDVAPDGVFGLQRGFKLAGTDTIVMSLWEVSSDVSQYFMVSFFKNLIEGKSRRNAFRAARAETKEVYPYGDWPAFIMLD